MQQNLNAYYQSTHPGEVQVIGVDLWNGSAGQVNTFKTQTGATFPLLLQGATATGGNVQTLYGTYDNYLVINKQGIVRYHAALDYAAGNRYHLAEIRAAVDSLLAPTADVPPGLGRGLSLAVGPSPTRGRADVTLALPGAAAEVHVDVFDTSGRRIAGLWSGAAPAGALRLRWDGRDSRGGAVGAGVYLVHARIGTESVTRRLVVTP